MHNNDERAGNTATSGGEAEKRENDVIANAPTRDNLDDRTRPTSDHEDEQAAALLQDLAQNPVELTDNGVARVRRSQRARKRKVHSDFETNLDDLDDQSIVQEQNTTSSKPREPTVQAPPERPQANLPHWQPPYSSYLYQGVQTHPLEAQYSAPGQFRSGTVPGMGASTLLSSKNLVGILSSALARGEIGSRPDGPRQDQAPSIKPTRVSIARFIESHIKAPAES